ETFAAVRDAYEIERDDKLQLRDFPTINAVVGFVHDHRPDLAQSATLARPAEDRSPSPAVGTSDPVTQKVMEIIAEQTGYPVDMLDPELDLEADLGIDTVKQAETFAAVRDTFEIERDDKLQLRDFPTVNHVVEFVYDNKPELRGTRAAFEAESGDSLKVAAAARAQLLSGSMEAAASIPRRVPRAVLRPAFKLCQATSVTLAAGKRVMVMADAGGVGTALVEALEKKGVEVVEVDGAPSAEQLTQRLEAALEAGPVHGVYWLPGLDGHAAITELTAESYNEALRVRVKLLYHTMRVLYEQVASQGTFLITATRLGGQHGYGDEPAHAPLGGAVTGFTKAYQRERPGVLVKAVDFAADAGAEAIVPLLLAEAEHDPGVVEVGHLGKERWTVALFEETLSDQPEGMKLDQESIFVVTGAAGSIVSAIVADLAKASGGIFYLLDLTEEPDAADADLARFTDDREGLKREIFERLKAEGKRATPKRVDRELAGLERKQAALAAMEAVRAAGGTAHYYSIDLLDGAAVRAVMDEVRQAHGRVDVLLHAAGLEISRFLPDKEPLEFDRVFDVKALGWQHLLAASHEMPLGATVGFSSIAGRFGNGGQTDYSAANDLLCKTSSGLRAHRPETRAIVLDWTAWAGIGMASRGSIPKMMEMAGIDMLPPEAGIAFVRRELTMAPVGCEVVVAQALGVMLEESDETGGLNVEAVMDLGQQPLMSRVLGMGPASGLRVETELDPREQPFLYDHQIDGTPVLPGVMGIEAFAELAKVLFPDWHVAAVEDMSFLAPFKFYRDQPRKLLLKATYQRRGEEWVAHCELVGERELKGQAEKQVTTHFTGCVRLVRKALKKEKSKAPKLPNDGSMVGHDEIYQIYFHGPAYQVLDKSWREGGAVYGLMSTELPADAKPEGVYQEMLPRLIELCFQTAGVWEIGCRGSLGLPRHIEHVSVLRPLKSAKGQLCAVVTPDESGERYDAYVTDEKGQVFVKIAGYSTISLPGGVDEAKRRPLRAVME
ncbi:MAG: SDR family NAD(P)-dependent oxidoreductase, partial [Deltaproteobacteria bacterium]|nr:SDR family NAD(P)-dependent oxidoreductase [Deltaproteobacteria bacterium]